MKNIGIFALNVGISDMNRKMQKKKGRKKREIIIWD